MTPLDYYRKKCHEGLIVEDQQQLWVLEHLQQVHANLLRENAKRNRLLNALRKPRSVKGLYIWGSVGIGKTFLLDCFYHCLPFKNKLRIHFHRFMQTVHHELKKLQGEKNPLQKIAKQIADQAMVLCFDELIVNDIVDAMILARLFKALFVHGVTIILTSNTEPDDLYKRGLQREQFLPAIDLLKQHTTVLHVLSTVDYRLRYLKSAGVFYTPNDAAALEHMKKTFYALTNGKPISTAPIHINDREIPVVKRTEEVIWFDFNVICHVPRSQHDYLVLASMFHTVFISNMPIISAAQHDVILLLIRLVDVFYDAKVRLVFSAAAPVEELYTQGRMLAEFARTRSRLLEMQSESYFLHE